MKKFLFRLIDFFYPLTCSACGKKLDYLSQARICGSCKKSFPAVKGLLCQKCGVPLYDGGEHCYVCRKHPVEYCFDKMRSVYLYKDPPRSLILKFKYSNRTFLARDFALAMCETMKSHSFYSGTDFIIPVPINIVRRIKRGYNQTELLANEISRETNIPALNNVLFRSKITKPQFKLSKSERWKNIENSFFVQNNNSVIKDKTILLIDDIVTTSATVSSCSLVLKTAGAKKVYVLTLARD
jgi:competence protein ComFC